MNKYDYLQLAALFITPVAPAFAFGWGVYSFAMELSNFWLLAIPVGVSGAIGLEVMGIFAGHVMLEAWRQKQTRSTLLALIALVIYMSIGIYELQGTIFVSLFIIAGCGYMVVGAREALQKDEAQTSAQAEQKTINEGKAQDQKHEQEMAKIEAKKEIAIARVNAPKVSESFPKVSEGEGKVSRVNWATFCKKAKYADFEKVAGMTPQEIADEYGQEIRTARNWKRAAKVKLLQSNGAGV